MRDRLSDIEDAGLSEDDPVDWLSQEEEGDEDQDEAPKVGRPRIPAAWTRVIPLHQNEHIEPQPYELSKDLVFNDAICQSLEEPPQSSIIFWPKDWFPGLVGWDLEVHKLS